MGESVPTHVNPTFPYTLSPVDVADLRVSVKRPGPSDGTFGQGIPPHLIYRPAQGFDGPGWELHAYGRLQAVSADPRPLLAALEREASDPAFIVRLLNPALDPETALLPRATLNERMREAIREAEARERSAIDADDAAWRKRRVQLMDPARVTLNDIFD